jgi:hypothetical protein
MKFLSQILFIAVLLIIAGCNTTSQDLRTSTKDKGAIHVDLPFNTVRENILTQSKKCYYGGVNAAYYTHEVIDKTPGEFTTLDIVLNGPNTKVKISADIVKNPNGGVDVIYFTGYLISPDFMSLFNSWATGEQGKCSK